MQSRFPFLRDVACGRERVKSIRPSETLVWMTSIAWLAHGVHQHHLTCIRRTAAPQGIVPHQTCASRGSRCSYSRYTIPRARWHDGSAER
jgi:hypothetical protein